VTKAGGTIVNPRTHIGDDMGWFATVADPSGIVFSFHTSKAPA
jgi:predicted enzyme related to lactoylglutathione lyase